MNAVRNFEVFRKLYHLIPCRSIWAIFTVLTMKNYMRRIFNFSKLCMSGYHISLEMDHCMQYCITITWTFRMLPSNN